MILRDFFFVSTFLFYHLARRAVAVNDDVDTRRKRLLAFSTQVVDRFHVIVAFSLFLADTCTNTEKGLNTYRLTTCGR